MLEKKINEYTAMSANVKATNAFSENTNPRMLINKGRIL